MDINKILDGADALQEEMHKTIDQIKKTERGKKLPYQDLVTVFLFMKISELQQQISNEKH